MKDIQTKTDIREYARLLKNFYGELYTYIIVNCGLILIWLFSGAGYFWPIWPILTWGMSLLIKASKLKVIDSSFYDQCHQFREKMMFLKKDWEDAKVVELLKRAEEKGILKTEEKVLAKDGASPKAAPQPKASAPAKKPAASKPKKAPVTKKAPVKK